MKNIFLLLLLVPIALPAQQSLTIEQYRNRVVEYSNSLKMSSENLRAAQHNRAAAHADLLPSLAASANGSYQLGNSSQMAGMTLKDYSYTANATLQQVVWGGGAFSAQYSAAKTKEQIATATLQQSFEAVLYSAEITYWAFAAAAEQYSISERYVEIVDGLYQIVNTRFKDGYVSKTDLLMVQTRLNEAQMQLISSRQLYQTSLQNLNILVGKYEAVNYIAADSITSAVQLPARVQWSSVLDNRPEYQIAALNVELQHSNVRLAASPFNPTFVVGLQGIYGTQSINIDGSTKSYGVAFAQLNVPIFSWGKRRQSVGAAQAAVRAMEYSMSQTSDQISGELSNAYITVNETTKQLQVAYDNLAAASDNLSLNTFSYSEGRLPIIDVLQSQLSWIQAYTSYLNANYQLKVAISNCRKAAGEMRL